MKKEIGLIFIKDKNKNKNNNNIIQKSIFINSERSNLQTNFFGKKRAIDRKILSISKPITYCIKRTKINNAINNSICPICLQNISLDDKHYCHCGHIFHCACINHWIDSGKNECPVCRQIIDCIYHLPREPVIELNEDENENHNNNNNHHHYNNGQNLTLRTLRNKIILDLIYVFLFFYLIQIYFICPSYYYYGLFVFLIGNLLYKV